MLRKKSRKKKQPEKVLGYGELLEQRFLDRGGRLFVVDVVKPRVLRAVRELQVRQNINECLYVVKKPSIAREYARSLYPDGDVRIIEGMQDMRQSLAACGLDMDRLNDSRLCAAAETFKSAFPRIIVCYEDSDGAILHGALCSKDSFDGMFSTCEAADFCISDFLAECGYGFIFFDDVYDMLAFAPAESEKVEELPSPAQFERMVFRGKPNYASVRHSYARLLRMADSCDQCVILSDILADRNILSVYLTLSMLHPAFPYRKARAFVRNHAENYADECENLYGALSVCYGNSTTLSLCMQKLQGVPQYTPRDLDSLSVYFETQFQYMAQEEIYVRAVYSQAQRLYHGEYASNRVILRRLEDDAVIADAFCDIFFSDPLKRVFENPECPLRHEWISDMDQDEFLKLQSIMEQFGGYILETPQTKSFKITRVYHDESGFEELIRRLKDKDFNQETNAYTTVRYSRESHYRGISLKHLVETEGLETPVLVLTRDSVEELCECLEEILPGVTCSVDPLELLEMSERRISFAVMDYSHFRALALELPVKTVVFCDLLYDIGLMDRLIKKAQSLRSEGVTVRALTDHRGVGGYLADEWERILGNAERRTIPVDLSRIVYDEHTSVDSEELLGQIDSVHRALCELLEGRYEGHTWDVSQAYRNLLVNYSKNPPKTLDEIHEDFTLFSKLARKYERLFSNSVSVGGKGESAYSLQPSGRKPSKKSRKNPTLRRSELFDTQGEEPRLCFNVCARQLFGRCDVTVHNCASCEWHRELKINDYEEFFDGADTFFKKASKHMTQNLENLKKEEQDRIIKTAQKTVDDLKGKLETVNQYAERCEVILRSLTPIARDTLFFTDYSQIEEIRNMASRTLAMFFEPYYRLLISVFEQTTTQMKKALETSEWSQSDTKGSEAVHRRK